MSVLNCVTRRAHVVLPAQLIDDIDKLVGKRGRSAFLTELARDEIMRRSQRDALKETAGAWKDKDHPELAQGSAEWVREMRNESEKRFEGILKKTATRQSGGKQRDRS